MSRKQFPPQKGPYIVKVKSGQSTDRWADFERARLQISVGQDYHEGSKLSALVAWCQHRFEDIVVCANDTLQRFNIMFEKQLAAEVAEQNSSALGREWVKRNGPIITGVPHARIVRWDEWKSHPQYPKGYLQIEWLYTNNHEFRVAIDKNIMDIWGRRRKIKPELYTPKNFERFFDLSRQYLLEEMATFALMYETEEAIDIYPGTTLFAATLFQGREVANAPPGLGKGHFCRVDFSKNKQFSPNRPANEP